MNWSPLAAPRAGTLARSIALASRPAGLLALLIMLVGGCSHTKPKAVHFDPRQASSGGGTNFTALETTNHVRPEWLEPSKEPFRLGPGDLVEIEILGEEEPPTTALVGPDGKIYFQILPGMQVWGLTLEETRRLIEREASQYVNTPQVAITLRAVQSKRVWVLGRVTTPGLYPLEAPMTILEAISRAGGLYTSRFTGTTEELADLHHSFLVRRGEFLPIRFDRLIREGDTSQNIYLEADDFIYLPSALSSEVYVLGAVYQPRSVGFKDQLTLVSAIANARGTIKDAWLGSVAIIRGSLTSPQIAVVDYNAIIKGRATDILLQPRDIVYVPFSPYRTLSSYANLIVNTFVRTVAANEGGRAVNPDYQQPGPSIPITQ